VDTSHTTCRHSYQPLSLFCYLLLDGSHSSFVNNISYQKMIRRASDLSIRVAAAPSRKTEVYTFALCLSRIRTIVNFHRLLHMTFFLTELPCIQQDPLCQVPHPFVFFHLRYSLSPGMYMELSLSVFPLLSTTPLLITGKIPST
jgi:hypothetical protein